MQAHQVSYKLYFDAAGGLELEDFIPIFHTWIRERQLDDDVMVDVADYAHVPDGPGVLLVCHEGHYVVEHREGRWGLCYNRKRGGETDDLATRLTLPLRRLATAASLLSRDAEVGGKLGFATNELLLRVQSRLHAPNTEETMAAVGPALQTVVKAKFGATPVTLAREGEPRELFTVRIKAEAAPGLEALAAG